MLVSELLEKKKHRGSFWTGYSLLDSELARIYHTYLSQPTILTPISQVGSQNYAPDLALQPGIPVNSCCEISGPPGCGKSALYLSLLVDALKQGYNVLYITCNYARFPIERVEQMEGFDYDKYRDKIDCVYVDMFSQVPAILMNIIKALKDDEHSKKYGMIILNRYDCLIYSDWSVEMQVKAYNVVSQLMGRLSQHLCIISTCGVRKKFSIHEDNSKLLTAASNLKSKSDTVVPFMLYKNTKNNAVLYSGFPFSIDQKHGVCAPASVVGECEPLSQHNFPTVRRSTQSKYELLTPASKNPVRRSSISTPSKRRVIDISQSCSPRRTKISSAETYIIFPNDRLKSLPSNDQLSEKVISDNTISSSTDTTSIQKISNLGDFHISKFKNTSIPHSDSVEIVENSQIEYNDKEYALF